MKAGIFLGAAVLLGISIHDAHAQGALTPPGPPTPTMKSLDQIEPRTPITNLPYTISQPGSYYVTTNLSSATTGISINAGNVTLDLNGFELVGGGVAAPLNGIFAGSVTNLCIRNGSVRDFGQEGVTATAQSMIVQQVRAIHNGRTGFRLGPGAVIQDCVASENNFAGTGVGFDLGADSVMMGCVSRNNLNAANGVLTSTGCLIRDTVVSGNNNGGIVVGNGSAVMGCVARLNIGVGIIGGAGVTIRDCLVQTNNAGGIRVSSESSVTGNTCDQSNAAGIQVLAGRCRIEGNNVTRNARGIEVGAAGTTNIVIRNTAGLNPNAGSTGLSNYVFTGFVIFGATNNLTDSSGLITNQNPWANFSY